MIQNTGHKTNTNYLTISYYARLPNVKDKTCHSAESYKLIHSLRCHRTIKYYQTGATTHSHDPQEISDHHSVDSGNGIGIHPDTVEPDVARAAPRSSPPSRRLSTLVGFHHQAQSISGVATGCTGVYWGVLGWTCPPYFCRRVFLGSAVKVVM